MEGKTNNTDGKITARVDGKTEEDAGAAAGNGTSGLLKFITCGSVDDGKSTLIGHMLYDAKLLFADQERALELDSRVGSRGGAYFPSCWTA